jgi:DNA-binding protein Fis
MKGPRWVRANEVYGFSACRRLQTTIKKIIAKLERQQRELWQILHDLRELDGSAGVKVGRVVRLDDHERSLIAAALRQAEGNQSEAARMLDISRDRLRYKMVKYRLNA